MGKLIDVVASLVKEIQQSRLLEARLGPSDDLRLIGKDAIPEEAGGFEAGGFDLLLISPVIRFGQTEADKVREIFSLGFGAGFCIARVRHDRHPSFQLKTQRNPGLLSLHRSWNLHSLDGFLFVFSQQFYFGWCQHPGSYRDNGALTQ